MDIKSFILGLQKGKSMGGGDSSDEWVAATGNIEDTNTASAVTVTHGLGVIPDIIFVSCNVGGSMPTSGSGAYIMAGCVVSEKLLASLPGAKFGYTFMYNPANKMAIIGTNSAGIENATNSSGGVAVDVTTQTMQLGSSTFILAPNKSYSWTACARK